MPPYVPPHLRPGFKPAPKPEKPKGQKIHFKSNVSGLRSENERWHRFVVRINGDAGKATTRSEKAKHQSNALTRRKIRVTPYPKPIVKGTRKAHRRVKSASPKRLKKKKHTVKSK